MNARSALALSRRFALLAIVGDSVRETPGRPRTTMLGDKYCTFMIPFPRQTVCASEAVWGAGERAVRVRARGRQTDRVCVCERERFVARERRFVACEFCRVECVKLSAYGGRQAAASQESRLR
jgi:hypothetical protein